MLQDFLARVQNDIMTNLIATIQITSFEPPPTLRARLHDLIESAPISSLTSKRGQIYENAYLYTYMDFEYQKEIVTKTI